MTENPICPDCGAEIPPYAPLGACPACLARWVVEPDEASAGTAADRRGDDAPTPEELAAHFPGLTILELLGRGGMGFVYKARHKHLDRLVALKVLSTTLAEEASFAERFRREARILARLDHPNIVSVHDYGEADSLFYFVMEYVDGWDLRRILRERRLGPREALSLIAQICDALGYAHDRGVIHRDIKPENILVDPAGRVKLADFGLSRLMRSHREHSGLTGSRHALGTPSYMAPDGSSPGT